MAYNAYVAPKTDYTGADGLAYTDVNRIEGNILALLRNAGRTNLLINGGFDLWQRANSRSISGGGFKSYYTADRWYYYCDGATTAVTESRQSHTVGQSLVPGNPLFFHRTQVTAQGGDMTANTLEQQIEDVRTCAGETITLSFWAKANVAGRTIIPSIAQQFGTGGSTAVWYVGATQTLTTSWALYTVTFTLSSISGKTIGTADTHFLGLYLKQSLNLNCTIDVANVKLERGDVATPWIPKGIQQEFQDCLRFFECIDMNVPFATAFCYSTTQALALIAYSPKRITPIPAKTGGSYILYSNVGGDITVTGVTYPTLSNRHCRANMVVASGLVGGNGSMVYCSGNQFLVDAEFYA